MAHYDPRGEVAPHVRRQGLALSRSVDDVVFVSTASLTDESRHWFKRHGRLIERANYGYDFYSYRTGLEAAPPLGQYDEVVICNDTYVGPLVSYTTVFDAMARLAVDFWGLTRSRRIAPHIQSFFVVFRPWVVASRAFGDFWTGMTPISDRRKVISLYEVGMSQRLSEAGFAWEPYFKENSVDDRIARRRMAWWTAHRKDFPDHGSYLAWWAEQSKAPWNPAIALADRALDEGRLPCVKIDTLRYDPYGLNASRLLDLSEHHYAAEFEGVRAFLDDTSKFYPPREVGALRPTPLALKPMRPVLEYRDAS